MDFADCAVMDPIPYSILGDFEKVDMDSENIFICLIHPLLDISRDGYSTEVGVLFVDVPPIFSQGDANGLSILDFRVGFDQLKAYGGVEVDDGQGAHDLLPVVDRVQVGDKAAGKFGRLDIQRVYAIRAEEELNPVAIELLFKKRDCLMFVECEG